MNYKGALVISLDFELLWGVFDKVDYKEKVLYFKNTRRVIPKILQLFAEYEIHCTWATVGMLFNEDWDDWKKNQPEVIPTYCKRQLSPYSYGRQISSPETEICCFSKDLIEEIKKTPHQEIGTHTYSHYYCLEDGQTPAQFRADLSKCLEMAKYLDISLESLVFPRNQFNEDYLEICYDLGIRNVRANPENWYWNNPQKDNLFTKIFRTGDAYVGLKDKSYSFSNLKIDEGKPLIHYASRLLRPHSTLPFLNFLRLNRIKAEMNYAARNNQIYHLWWHPHNFGHNPEKNLQDLKTILHHFKRCQRMYGFDTLNMQEVNNLMGED